MYEKYINYTNEIIIHTLTFDFQVEEILILIS